MEIHQEIGRKHDPDDEGNCKMSKKKSYAIEVAIQKLTRKIFELELFEKMAEETGAKLGQKKKEVVEEERKLEELQYERLDRMEAFCDEIWKFSSSNDLYATFNRYLDMPRLDSWQYGTFDIELDPDIVKLKNENDKLKEQLAEEKSIYRSLEDSLRKLELEIQIAESYRENDPEIINLRKSIEKSQEDIKILNSRRAKIEKEIGAENRQRSIVVDKIQDEIFDFVTASELIERSDIDRKIKKPKFSVKKESEISKRMANKRGKNGSKS